MVFCLLVGTGMTLEYCTFGRDEIILPGKDLCEAKGAGRVSGTQGSLVAICAIFFLLID